MVVKERFDDEIYLNYMRKEIRSDVASIEHGLIREAMRMTGVESGVEVTLLSDIPSEGSGLGSSSSFTVGLLNAFYAYRGEQVTAERLASEACEIEIERLGKPIGKQDQYIAAYGGLRGFRFRRDGAVEVKPLRLPGEKLRELSARLHLFFTGKTRQADGILSEQRGATRDRLAGARRDQAARRRARARARGARLRPARQDPARELGAQAPARRGHQQPRHRGDVRASAGERRARG